MYTRIGCLYGEVGVKSIIVYNIGDRGRFLYMITLTERVHGAVLPQANPLSRRLELPLRSIQ